MRLALALFLLAAPLQAQTFQQAVVFGAEWDDYNVPAPHPVFGAGIIQTYAHVPPSRGIATVTFPDGGQLWGWEWNLTVKRPGHIVLAALAVLGTDGQVRRIGVPLFFDFREQSPAQTKERAVQLKRPVRLNPGDMVFFGVTGWGDACPLDTYGYGCSVMEGHAALYVDEGTVTVPEAR